MEIKCDICGRLFVAKRSDARYCSGTCRTRAQRIREGKSWYPNPGRPPEKLSDRKDIRQISVALANIRMGASSLRQISKLDPALDFICAEIADGIEALLEERGL